MNKKYYFIAGLPRSGSTLLCNILSQNPAIYASATSGLVDIMAPVKNGWNDVVAMKAMQMDESYHRLSDTLRGILTGYYESINKEVIFDKSRAWPKYIPMMKTILPEVKIIMMVRKLPEVFASLEKLYRKTGSLGITSQEKLSPQDFISVESRCTFWARGDQLIGSSLNLIKDAISCGYNENMHFVDFKYLTQSPKSTLEGIYNFLGLDNFKHNFDNVEQVTREDDRVHGWIGLHNIRSKVEYIKPDYIEILGKELSTKLSNQEVW